MISRSVHEPSLGSAQVFLLKARGNVVAVAPSRRASVKPAKVRSNRFRTREARRSLSPQHAHVDTFVSVTFATPKAEARPKVVMAMGEGETPQASREVGYAQKRPPELEELDTEVDDEHLNGLGVQRDNRITTPTQPRRHLMESGVLNEMSPLKRGPWRPLGAPATQIRSRFSKLFAAQFFVRSVVLPPLSDSPATDPPCDLEPSKQRRPGSNEEASTRSPSRQSSKISKTSSLESRSSEEIPLSLPDVPRKKVRF